MRKPTCLVLDANVWRSRSFLALNTPLAAALLFALRRREGLLGLPEVLEDEVVRQLGEIANEAADQVEAGAATLELLGLGQNLEPPFDREYLAEVGSERLNELRDFVVRTPFTLDHARRALERVHAGTPPNNPRNQQFKDSAIWEALLELAAEFEVVFVTGDKGFFEQRDPKQGLAASLAAESTTRNVLIDVIYAGDHDKVLRRFDVESVRIEKQRVLEAVQADVSAQMERDAARRGFVLGPPSNFELTAYVTAQPNVLAVTFGFAQGIAGATPAAEQLSGELRTSGQCFFDTDTGATAEVTLTLVVANMGEEYDVWALRETELLDRSYGLELPLI